MSTFNTPPNESRRGFVKALGLALAGATLAPQLALAQGTPSSTTEKPEPSHKSILFTIDDGYHYQEELLAVANQHNVKVLMFVVGECLHGARHAWRKALDDGHMIGCHSYTHFQSSRVTEEQFRADCKRWMTTYVNLFGAEAFQKVYHYRFPYGDQGGRRMGLYARILEEEYGWKHLGWDVDASFTASHASFRRADDQFAHIKQNFAHWHHDRPMVVLSHFKQPDIGSLDLAFPWAVERGIDATPEDIYEHAYRSSAKVAITKKAA